MVYYYSANVNLSVLNFCIAILFLVAYLYIAPHDVYLVMHKFVIFQTLSHNNCYTLPV